MMKAFASKRFKQITNFTAAFILMVSTFTAFGPLFLSQTANAAGATVSPANMNGWLGFSENTAGASLNFVNGPATAPLGNGSAQFTTTASGQGYFLGNGNYGGLKLADIDTLSYSTYIQQGNNLIAPALQFNITSDPSNLAWQGRLVYEPYQTETVTDGVWQTHNALEGEWWFSGPANFGNNCSQASTCTIPELLDLYPNLAVSVSQPLTGFKVGSNWTPFIGNVDNFVINQDVYDFEPSAPNTPPVVTFNDPTPAENAYVSGLVNASVTAVDDYGMGSYYVRFWKNAFESGPANLLHSCYAAPGAFNLGTSETADCAYNVSALAEGTTVVLSAQFLDGHNQWGSALRTFTVDNQKPATFEITNPLNGSSQQGTFTVSGIATDATSDINQVRYNVRNVTAIGGTTYGGAVINWTDGTYDTTTDTWTFDVNGLDDGIYRVAVQAIDMAGNFKARHIDVIVDNQAPTADLVFEGYGPAYDGFKVVFNEAVNEAEAENPTNYFLENWDGAGGSGDLAGDATVVYNPATFTATVSFTSPDWYISAEQKWGVQNIHDLAGNVMNPTSEYSSPLEAPTTPSINAMTSPTTDTNLNWSWTASVDQTNLGAASGFKHYEYSFTKQGDPLAWVVTTDTSFNTTVSEDGVYQLRVRAYDNAGNVSGTDTKSVIVDTTPIDVEINALNTADTTPTVTGTVNDPAATVTLTVNGASVSGVINNGDGTWSYTFPTELTDGTYQLVATATDEFGLSDSDTENLVVATVTPGVTPEDPTPEPQTVATINPVTPIITSPGAAGVLGNDTNTEDDADVEGASTIDNVAALDTDASDGSIFGLAWYWWILILAALATLISIIVAAFRRRREEA